MLMSNYLTLFTNWCLFPEPADEVTVTQHGQLSPLTFEWPLRRPPTKCHHPVHLSVLLRTFDSQQDVTHTLIYLADLRGRKLTVELMFACWDLIRLLLLWYDLISWHTHTHTHSYSITLSLPLPVCLSAHWPAASYFIAVTTICCGRGQEASSISESQSSAIFNSYSTSQGHTHTRTQIHTDRHVSLSVFVKIPHWHKASLAPNL